MSLITNLSKTLERLQMQLHRIHMRAMGRDTEHQVLTQRELKQVGRITGLINSVQADIAVAEHAAAEHGETSRQVLSSVNIRRRMDRLQKQLERIRTRPAGSQRDRQIARLQEQLSALNMNLQEILGGPGVGTPPAPPLSIQSQGPPYRLRRL